MDSPWWAIAQYTIFLVVVVVCVKPLGRYMAHVFERRNTFLDPVLFPVEKIIYRICRVDPTAEMTWPEYARAFVVFTLSGSLLLFALLKLQGFLPLFSVNAANISTPMSADIAMNTAISFVTTATW